MATTSIHQQIQPLPYVHGKKKGKKGVKKKQKKNLKN